MNILWHAGVSVLVALLVRRWSGDTAALVSGLLFAVHPVHVEAVANIVGRAELMAALFAVLAVYAALGRDSVAVSAVALSRGPLEQGKRGGRAGAGGVGLDAGSPAPVAPSDARLRGQLGRRRHRLRGGAPHGAARQRVDLQPCARVHRRLALADPADGGGGIGGCGAPAGIPPDAAGGLLPGRAYPGHHAVRCAVCAGLVVCGGVGWVARASLAPGPAGGSVRVGMDRDRALAGGESGVSGGDPGGGADAVFAVGGLGGGGGGLAQGSGAGAAAVVAVVLGACRRPADRAPSPGVAGCELGGPE